MAEVVTLTVQPREGRGSRAAAKLRKQGLIPAVIYGHKQDVAHVAINAEELDRAVRVQHARTLALSLNNQRETVLIKELQWDYLGKEMIHVDFERRDLTERVKVTIPVELRGTPKSMGGGVLDQPLHQLHIECALGSIPESVRIDITNLTLGNPIHVRELSIPEGVKVLDGLDMVVVHLKLPGAEAAAPLPTVEEEPEVLTAKKPKEEEESK